MGSSTSNELPKPSQFTYLKRNNQDPRISNALTFSRDSIPSMANIAIVVSFRSILCIRSRIVANKAYFVLNSLIFSSTIWSLTLSSSIKLNLIARIFSNHLTPSTSNIAMERTKEISNVIVTSENARRLQDHITILDSPELNRWTVASHLIMFSQ
jgi:hypothetical protein